MDILGGGLISGLMKHSKIEQAGKQVEQAICKVEDILRRLRNG